jgi:hypothetical protein
MQKTRNSVFDAMISWNGVNNSSELANEYIQTFTDIAIMERFGWSFQQLLEAPLHLYDDIVLIMNKQSALHKIEIEKMKSKK